MMLLLQNVFQWWLVIFLLGIIVLPFTVRFFYLFFDKGYAFSKTIGIITISYAAYLLGTLHVLPFTTISIFFLIFLTFLASLIFRKNTFSEIKKTGVWKIMLWEELLFFAALFFWSYIKCFQPDIHGLEKFMDYGFINSLLRTTYFPAKDIWMAPLSINYYYFGHLATAVLTKISFLQSNITFNLMLASIFAFTFTGAFSLGANFIYFIRGKSKKDFFTIIFMGIFSAFLLTMAGNLHTIYTFFTPYQNSAPVPPTQLTFSPQTFPNQYWYPNATRFIYHTIHEFPIYSFVVSDLHGHVLDIPNVLLMIAVLLVIFYKKSEGIKQIYQEAVLTGSLASILYMTNAWDGLIYTGIAAVLFFTKVFNKKLTDTFFSKKFFYTVSFLVGSFIIVSLPFSLFFKPFASQIGLNCAPQFLLHIKQIGPFIFERGYCQVSPLWQLAILYGFFFFWFVSLLTFIFIKVRKKEEVQKIDLFVAGMGVFGFALIIVPEFLYLKDIYTTYFRANTMFKLVYQAFILLMLLSGYTIFRIFSQIRISKKTLVKKIFSFCYIIFSFILLSLVFIYPYFAIMSYFNNLSHFRGLNGTTYLKSISPSDYRAIQWINTHIHGQPTMLEAQGDSYTDYERISSNTGLPTVFGWTVHEWLWRGTYDVVPGRIAAVTALYESRSLETTKDLLQKYGVSYVYIGAMERLKYPSLDEKKFAKLGTVFYHSGSVTIYKINN